jgi:hypothetical protein
MKNNKQQTAVELLVDQLEKHYVFQDIKNTTAFLQAKEMEKEQMIDFARKYMLYIHKEGIITIETFYNETYGGNK